jgi:hypothetical protein
MTEGRQTRDIDQAALILALLVAGWQIADQSGPWGVVNTPIGLVLLLVIGAYSNPTLDRKFLRIYLQVAAVAVGGSFAICMALAFPAQALIYLITVKWCGWQVSGDQLGDYTTNFAFPVILLFAVPFIYRRILWRIEAAAKGGHIPNDEPKSAPPTDSTPSPVILLFAAPCNNQLIVNRTRNGAAEGDAARSKAQRSNSTAEADHGSENTTTADQAVDLHVESVIDSSPRENSNEDVAPEESGEVAEGVNEKVAPRSAVADQGLPAVPRTRPGISTT